VAAARKILQRGNEVGQMMKVVGEEGTALEDFIVYLKGEYLDAVYLQQDAYDAVDAASSHERQQYVFEAIGRILRASLAFPSKDAARQFFHRLTQATKDWNRVEMQAEEFKKQQARLEALLAEVTRNA
jgi:V/A-type H+-transporting ATPase subunit A